MGGKKNLGENSKKASGQARKAEAAAQKQATKEREVASKEESEWNKGAKDNSKKEAAAAKATEAARKKAEKAALAAEEEASLPTKAKSGNAKAAQKKSRGLDLSQLDGPDAGNDTKSPTLNATGIDNALDALAISSSASEQVDRHPERRYKAAYAVFEERRLEEMKDEKGLRRNQKVELIRKEFEKHPENPFNQVAGKYNSTKGELRDIAGDEKKKIEARLAEGSAA